MTIELVLTGPGRGRDEYDQLNGNGVPLLIVNGEIIRGYNPDRIIQLAKNR